MKKPLNRTRRFANGLVTAAAAAQAGIASHLSLQHFNASGISEALDLTQAGNTAGCSRTGRIPSRRIAAGALHKTPTTVRIKAEPKMVSGLTDARFANAL